MDCLSEKEILNYALSNGMLDASIIQKQIEMNKRKEYLEMHKSKIWQSTDSKWYTFLPDETKKNGRKLVKRGTKEEIEDLIAEYYKNQIEKQTIEKTYKEWIEKKLKFEEISRQSVDRYNADFYKFFAECKDRDVKYITSDFLDDFIIGIIKTYNLRQKAWNNVRIIIRGVFRFAKKKGYTKFNINEYLQELELSRKLFNNEKKSDDRTVFTDSEITRILDYTKQKYSVSDMAIIVAIYTGMRVGEVLGLKWEDIGEKYIYVNRTQIKYKDESGYVVHEIRDFPKTEAGIRNVVIVDELRPIIKRLNMLNGTNEYLFMKNGEVIRKHTVCARLYLICDKLNITRRGMHALRRSYSTKLIDAGVEESIIISQMGHTTFETTKKYYYKNNKEEDYIGEQIEKAIKFC